MTLVLEIEYLTGMCFASVGPDSDAPDWPPQPDRVFSALVSTWAARGKSEPEERALKWLESQPVPTILASDATPRKAPISFVPPNDPKTGRSGDRSVMPAFRRRQPRRFPAARPHDPVVRMVWPGIEPDGGTLSALARLAADTAYIGRSASLTRCFFRIGVPEGDMPARRQAARRIYPGRLAELSLAYEAGRRPSPGEKARAPAEVVKTPSQSCFGENWLILEHVGEDMTDGAEPSAMPDIRASAVVAKTIRDALLGGYKEAGLGDRIPETVSGHAADGSPTRDPHLAIVPLAFAGFAHADGRVLGFALVPPRAEAGQKSLLDGTGFRQAFRKIAPMQDLSGGEVRRVLHVYPKGRSHGPRFHIALSPTFERPGRRSLNPELYTRPGRTFATVTPIVLDRHLKENSEVRQEEIVGQIAAACRHIGLPEPERIEPKGAKPYLAVFPGKHSALEGIPSAWGSRNAPSWTRWQLPASLASRALTHAVIRFAEPVVGPVILGAGRFVGLGLCRPVDGREAGR